MKTFNLLLVAFFSIGIPNKLVCQVAGYSNNDSKLLSRLHEFPITNSEKGSFTKDEFYGKNIIIDFWATWCIPCVANLPKMKKIQDEFGNRLKIVLVTKESKKVVDDFISTRKRIKKDTVRLPSIVSDNEIYKLFPHTSIPHYVWINANGAVMAITSEEDLTLENISKFVRGEHFDFIPKTDRFRIDRSIPFYNEKMSKPLLVDSGYFGPDKIKYRSVLTKSVPGYTANGGNFTGRLIGRSWIILLFTQAYEYSFGNKLAPVPSNRVIYEIKDRSKYFLSENANYADRVKWNEHNFYVYDLLMPEYYKGLIVDPTKDYLRKAACEVMKKNLETFTGLKSNIQNRTVNCVVLKSIDPTLHNATEKFENVGFLPGKTGFVSNSIENMMLFLNYFLDSELAPIINETGIRDKINIRVQTNDMSDIRSINNELRRYGLEMVKETRKIPMLVITD